MAKEVLEVKKAQYLKVPFESLALVEGLNIREDYGDIKELANSIRENGIIQPLRGSFEDGWYYIADGHRRYKALELLYAEGVKELYAPFMVQPKGTNEEQTVVEMFISNDGKPLTMLEQSTGIERLFLYGWEPAQIATKLAKSRTHIENMLKLAKAPAKFKKLVKKGIISATFAIDLLKQGEEAMNAFLQGLENTGAEEETENESAGSSKTAKVTKKNVHINSFSELKEFAKEAKINEFPKATTESFYWLLQDIAANKIQKTDLINFFTDGTYEQKEAAPAKVAKAKKEPKPAKAVKEPKAPKVAKPKAAKPAKAAKQPKAAKAAKPAKNATSRKILYNKDAE